ncbi:MAG: hypothetical protein ASARMPREDX12_002221 [Alectoria sarmentosa]|nr:MAG: hypothetical protein ASARMPREDX12_002221 [Alectoria sarmentosa]
MWNISELSSLAALRILLLGLISFLVCRAIYRLTLHPLARFPGPRLAAVTSLYGANLDLRTNTSYVKILPDLHDKYGPIVRIYPNQLHIRDIDAYNQQAVTPQAVAHKSMFTPFFSPEAIRRVEPLIQDFVNKFMDKMHTAASSGNVVNLSQGFRCLTADVIMNYSFQRPMGALEASGFEFPLLNALDGFAHTIQWRLYFPNAVEALFQIIQMLPAKMMAGFMEPLRSTQECLSFCRNRILDLKKRSPSPLSNVPTVFDIMLNPNTSKGQWTPELPTLTSDALMLLLAGTNTTAHTLVVAVYNLIHSPHLVQRLVAELRGAMSEPCSQNDWASLEKLPYLRAVVKESLRLSYGAPGPLPRVVPPTGAFLAGQHIPPGVSYSTPPRSPTFGALDYRIANIIHRADSSITQQPCLQPRSSRLRKPHPVSSRTLVMRQYKRDGETHGQLFEGVEDLSGHGLSSLHNSLAYAELYLTLGHLFRRYELELSGVTSADMEWDDMLVPITRGTLRVHVKESKT